MSTRLSFGYLCDFRNPAFAGRTWEQTYAETLDFIAWSETQGFEGAWVPEHHVDANGYCPSPNVLLAAIAARTSKIRIGSGVALAPLHHPVRFAEECAMLDVLSGGRLEMSLAIGYRRRETAAYGKDFTKRGAMFDEFLQIVRALWAGETVTFDGKFYQVDGASIMPLSPRGQVPLYIGGFAPKAIERVARYADGYFGNPEFGKAYREELARQGKDPAKGRVRVQNLFVTVAEDPEAAMEDLAPYFHFANNAYGEWMNEDKSFGIDSPGLKAMDLDAFKQSGILEILTPAQAIERYTAMRDEHGVEHVALMLPPGLPPERFMPYAQVFAKDVLPAFA